MTSWPDGAVSTTLMNHLKFNCWLLGDKPVRVFPVTIAISETIGALKEVIQDKLIPDHDYPAKNLDLWKVEQ